jgi:hypothetical protein
VSVAVLHAPPGWGLVVGWHRPLAPSSSRMGYTLLVLLRRALMSRCGRACLRRKAPASLTHE